MKKFLITIAIILCVLGGIILAKMKADKSNTNTANIVENKVLNTAGMSNEANVNNKISNSITNNLANSTKSSVVNSNTATINEISQTITKEDAEKIIENKYGKVDQETGNTMSYGYIATVQDKEGKKYYAFRESWLVDNSHLSFLQNVFVSIDGKTIKTTSTSSEYKDNQVVEFDEE